MFFDSSFSFNGASRLPPPAMPKCAVKKVKRQEKSVAPAKSKGKGAAKNKDKGAKVSATRRGRPLKGKAANRRADSGP